MIIYKQAVFRGRDQLLAKQVAKRGVVDGRAACVSRGNRSLHAVVRQIFASYDADQLVVVIDG
jgi:hypothetical protein